MRSRLRRDRIASWWSRQEWSRSNLARAHRNRSSAITEPPAKFPPRDQEGRTRVACDSQRGQQRARPPEEMSGALVETGHSADSDRSPRVSAIATMTRRQWPPHLIRTETGYGRSPTSAFATTHGRRRRPATPSARWTPPLPDGDTRTGDSHQSRSCMLCTLMHDVAASNRQMQNLLPVGRISSRRWSLAGAKGHRADSSPTGFLRLQPRIVRLSGMASELVPVRLGVTAGDLYTLWAPRWRDAGDEWEASSGGRGPLRIRVGGRSGGVRAGAAPTNDLADHPGLGPVGQG